MKGNNLNLTKLIQFFRFEANENPSSSGAIPKKRKIKQPKKKDNWDVFLPSASGSDTDGSGDIYTPSGSRTQKSLRGILAYQAATRQKGARLHIPRSNPASDSTVLFGVSSRGQLSGRGRVRVRGRQRGRSRTNSSGVSRADLLSQHRRIVSDVIEANTIEGLDDEFPQIEPNLPVLTEGIFSNNVLFEYIYIDC